MSQLYVTDVIQEPRDDEASPPEATIRFSNGMEATTKNRVAVEQALNAIAAFKRCDMPMARGLSKRLEKILDRECPEHPGASPYDTTEMGGPSTHRCSTCGTVVEQDTPLRS